MSPIFHPSLRSKISVPPGSTLYFSCVNTSSTGTPEVWTNLPGHEWHAVQFEQQGAESELSVASIDLPAQSEKDATFEFTFRIVCGDGTVAWLGEEGSNGVIEVSPGGEQVGVSCSLHQDFVVPPGSGSEESTLSIVSLLGSLGLNVSSCDGGVILEQKETWWFVPRTIPSGTPNPLSHISPDLATQLVILRLPSHQTLVLFPFCTDDVESTLHHNQETSDLSIRCVRDLTSDEESHGNLVIGLGPDGSLEEIVRGCISVAAKSLSLSSTSPTPNGMVSLRSPRFGLTWCTWNALGPHYALADVLSSLDGLLHPPSPTLLSLSIDSVLLDDGWQDTRTYEEIKDSEAKSRRCLWSFGVKEGWSTDGDSSEGLALQSAIQKIKEQGIKRVGVWMTIAGYWDAIHPSSPLSSTYSLSNYSIESPVHPSANTTWHLPSTSSSLDSFYNDYFSLLKSQGVDFVKIDDQARTDYFSPSVPSSNSLDSGNVRRQMFQLMRKAAHAHFGVGNVTHCMAGSPRIWTSPLALLACSSSSTSRDILRNSDDYFPHQPDSHRYHIAVNAMNLLYTRSLPGLQPCFDMCEADHPYGAFHLALRAFQPAPLLATDAAGSNVGGWGKLLARTNQGIRILQVSETAGGVLEGRIGEDILGSGTGPALKVGVEVIKARGALLGLWNCRAKDGLTSDVLDMRDVVDAFGDSMMEGSDYVLLLPASSKHDSPTLHLTTHSDLSLACGRVRAIAKPLLPIHLNPKEAIVTSLSPLHSISGSSIACVGLLDKYAGLCAIESVQVVNLSRFQHLRLPSGRIDTILHLIKSLQPSSSPSRGPFSLRNYVFTFVKDFLHHPFVTARRETRTVISWALGTLVNTLSRFKSKSLPAGEKNNVGSDEVLRIELGFVGKLGVVVMGDNEGKLEVEVDGRKVRREQLKLIVGAPGSNLSLVEVELDEFKFQGDRMVVDLSFGTNSSG